MGTVVKCPQCGKECKHQGALNLHMLHCDRLMQKSGKNPAAKKTQTCEGGCQFRYLKDSDPNEKKAIGDGWTEVCDKCLELQ